MASDFKGSTSRSYIVELPSLFGSRNTRSIAFVIFALLFVCHILLIVQEGLHSPFFQLNRPAVNSQLSQVIEVDNVMAHLAALESIAMAHPSHSRSVENAYNASAAYVIDQLRTHTDCDLSIQNFRVPIWDESKPVEMELTQPFQMEFQPSVDMQTMRYGGGAARIDKAHVSVVDDGGCLADQIRIAKSGIALIELDKALAGCSLWDAAFNAQNAGASAVLFYNSLSRMSLSSSRVRLVNWKEGDPLMDIPVLSVSHAVGQMLISQGSSARLNVETYSSMRIADTYNVVCDTKDGDPNSIVMIGSHLDSVPAGPGIVDNASGSGSVLEVFLKVYETELNKRLVNKLRFAWWGAEELGLMGSRHYCRELKSNPAEFDKVVVYSNHDMLGSPNYIPYIYRGGSAPPDLQVASTKLQSLYEDYFKALPPLSKFSDNYELEEMTGGSDFFSFLEVGIPSGGLATGAGSLKSAEQRHRFGGLANAAYDPCYHQACDTVENIAVDVLEVLAKSVGHVTESLALQDDLRQWIKA